MTLSGTDQCVNADDIGVLWLLDRGACNTIMPAHVDWGIRSKCWAELDERDHLSALAVYRSPPMLP